MGFKSGLKSDPTGLILATQMLLEDIWIFHSCEVTTEYSFYFCMLIK